MLANQNFVQQFLNYVDVGTDGNAVRLSTTTTVTTNFVGSDHVQSSGQFVGQNGVVQWIVDSLLPNGGDTVTNTNYLYQPDGQPVGQSAVHQLPEPGRRWRHECPTMICCM